MKKLLILLLCLVMSVCLFSCDESVIPKPNASSTEQSTTPDNNPEPEDQTPEHETPNDETPKDETPKDETPEDEMSGDETLGVDPSNWKSAYLSIIENRRNIDEGRAKFDSTYASYALVYIDGDDIPELYVMGRSEAEGDTVYSLKNGTIIKQVLGRTRGGHYIERSGQFVNQNGHMGHCYTTAYTFSESGFTQTLNAAYIEHYQSSVGKSNYSIIYEYFIDNEPVSEADYDAAVDACFDFTQAIRFDEQVVFYNEIKQQLS